MDLQSVHPIKAYRACTTLALAEMLLIIHLLDFESNAEKDAILGKVLCKEIFTV